MEEVKQSHFFIFQLANVVGAPCLIISTVVAICSFTAEICIWISDF